MRSNMLGGLVPFLSLCFAISALILVPFALWSNATEAIALSFLEKQQTQTTLVLVGIALLILDTALPIPASIISVAICITGGPIWGALGVFCGMIGSFVLSYSLGRLLPSAKLRIFVAPTALNTSALRCGVDMRALLMLSRPLPVLAEGIAVLSGALRVPFSTAFLAAAAASAIISAVYSGAVWLGTEKFALSIPEISIGAVLFGATTWAGARTLCSRQATTTGVSRRLNASLGVRGVEPPTGKAKGVVTRRIGGRARSAP